MALGMKHWVGLLVIGFLALGLWYLPPSVQPPRTGGTATPEEVRARDLRRETRRAHDILQRTRWADSLTPLALREADEGLLVSGDPRVATEETLDSVRVRIRAELARAEASGDAVIGLFIQPRSLASLERVPRGGRVGDETYMGERGGQAFCYRVFGVNNRVSHEWGDLRRSHWTEDQQHTNILGPCRLVARHGAPGTGVHAWLERGAIGFAYAPSDHPLRLRFGFGDPIVQLFGLGGMAWWTKSHDVVKCMSGIEEACTLALLDPSNAGGELQLDARYVAERSPVTGISQTLRGSPFATYDDYLLADLEAEFGRERFRAFWTSDNELTVAFESAFGMPMATWGAKWVRAHVGGVDAGPGLPRSASAGTGLVVLLSALAAAAWARRRKVA